MDDSLVKRLMATLKCGVCSQRYESDNVRVLGHRDELWFLSVFCPGCHSQGLVAAVIKEGKAPEVITDLTPEELEQFSREVSVGSNDLLDLHNFLRDFDGDFQRLFISKKE
ncbi:MAG TPA: hypothetical protein VJ565_00045 [Dehalococcoidia bacterium]|nr:hypothetical protein [Dehalococcoidia bacterium]